MDDATTAAPLQAEDIANPGLKFWYYSTKKDQLGKLFWLCCMCGYGPEFKAVVNEDAEGKQILEMPLERPCDRCRDDYNTAMRLEHGDPARW